MAKTFFYKYIQMAALLLIVCLAVTSCRQLDVYEKNVSIPAYQWKQNFVPGFDFEIKDTSSQYNIFIVLRHTDAYRYSNIWLNITGMLQNKDTLVRLPHVELQLGKEDKGWEGTGMDDIWEVRKPISKGPVQFKKAGLYHFTVAQIMREDPLLNVMSVGVRVERVR
jgi:gliding motility-associated lipoprotein GldH